MTRRGEASTLTAEQIARQVRKIGTIACMAELREFEAWARKRGIEGAELAALAERERELGARR